MDLSKTLSTYTRALIVVAVMAATLMQVLDITIVNVALPHMEGSLSASPDEITWILTSYLVASAIFMPLNGYFTARLGQKNYLLISITGFVFTSALCGAAENITQIVIFRLLQGVFGAALVPLSQSIMTDIFPPEERGTAMAIWGIGVMVGPVLGPTLGGYLTEYASWRWSFYINVPVGLLSLLLTWRFLPDTERKQRKMDWIGLGLISVVIGGLQFVLDRGNQEDWFSSDSICVTTFFVVVSALGFLYHCVGKSREKIVFNPSIFYDRNFAIASMLIAIFGLGFYGAMVILPIMLEKSFNYPVLTTGLVMAPRGLSGMLSMILVSRWIKKYDPRKLVLIGISFSSVGIYLGTFYNSMLSEVWIYGPIILQGFGLGMVFVPLTAIAFSTLPAYLRPEAAGMFSLLRTMGGSIGISIVSTLLARLAQMEWNQLGGHINPYNPAVEHFLARLQLDPDSPAGIMVLTKTLVQNAQMLSYINIYAFITWSLLFMVPFLFLLKKPELHKSVVEVVE